MKTPISILDTTTRDGMHPERHRLTPQTVGKIAAALDAAGVDSIEVAHGDGLAGSSCTYGPGYATDEQWITAARENIQRARLATLLIPGIGTKEDLRRAHGLGVEAVRVATHCSEADVALQHIEYARNVLGMDDVSGFLMMSHMLAPAALAQQAALMEAAGAHCVYIVDSAGALTPRDIRDRVRAYHSALRDSGTEIGIHAHENLSLSVANSLQAVEEGATRVDASLTGQGAGAGNCPVEAFVAVANRLGIGHGADLWKLQDAAEEIVRPLQTQPPQVNRDTLTLGVAGTYGSFFLLARRIGEKTGVDTRAILMEAGRRGLVGGQDDQIHDIGLELAG